MPNSARIGRNSFSESGPNLADLRRPPPHIVLDRAKFGLLSINLGQVRFGQMSAEFRQLGPSLAHCLGQFSVNFACDQPSSTHYRSNLALIRPKLDQRWANIGCFRLKSGTRRAMLAGFGPTLTGVASTGFHQIFSDVPNWADFDRPRPKSANDRLCCVLYRSISGRFRRNWGEPGRNSATPGGGILICSG